MFRLTLNNFRGFTSETFDFSRINILIGENSSGKSSILKFLLALKQSFERPNNQEANLTLSGEYVDLGNYSEIITDHDTTKNLGFTFEIKNHYKYFIGFLEYYFLDEFDNNISEEEGDSIRKGIYDKILNYLPPIVAIESSSSIHVELTSELDKHKSAKVYLESPGIGKLHISFQEKEKNIDRIIANEPPKCTLLFIREGGDTLELSNVECDINAFLTLIKPYSLRDQLESKYEDKEDVDAIFWLIAYLLVVQNHLTYILERVDFVNPIHSKPERFYYEKDKRSVYKVNDIEKLVNLIGKKSLPTQFLDNFYNIVSKYGLAQGIEVTADNKLPVKELRVQINDLWNNITDVGYAVSLQLPIIFQAYFSEFNHYKSILLIEQPEVHLHPKLQAKFIETLLSLGNGNIYFIETHSEYIIRKLQIIVKEKMFETSSDDISINYLSSKQNKTAKSIHKILDSGRLNPSLPSTFFDNSYELAIKLLN